MGFVAYQVTIPTPAAAIQCSSAFPDQKVGGQYDVPLRAITFQALKAVSNDIFVGADSTVSSTKHGFRVDSGDTQPPIILGSYDSGGSKISDFWINGTAGDTLLIGGVTF